jgi:hypothetical protein
LAARQASSLQRQAIELTQKESYRGRGEMV